jgi:hypothetical protein
VNRADKPHGALRIIRIELSLTLRAALSTLSVSQSIKDPHVLLDRPRAKRRGSRKSTHL